MERSRRDDNKIARHYMIAGFVEPHISRPAYNIINFRLLMHAAGSSLPGFQRSFVDVDYFATGNLVANQKL